MKTDTADKVIDNTFRDLSGGDEITFAFQGGEPTIAGLPWFRYFTETASSRMKDIKINYAFQTNGLLLDNAWCDFFCKNNFLLGLSIDAGRRFHDRNRFPAGHGALTDGTLTGGTFDDCMRSKKMLEENHVEYNILSVLTNDMAKEPDKVWNFIIREKIRYIQFIPCLEPPGAETDQKHSAGNALRPALFASFYSRLLPLWIREFESGNYISVKLFDEVVNYFLKGIPTACGIDGRCHNQYVIEADGSVYPCDFYCFDQYRIGNLKENTIKELFHTEKVQAFVNERRELPKICSSCKFVRACRGGCKRMRNVMYSGAGGIVCGLRVFLEKCLGPLELTVKKVFQ